jgi:hypothetical protein
MQSCCFTVAGCLKSEEKEQPRSSREFDINSELSLWGKLLLMHHSGLGVPTSGILKNTGVPSVRTSARERTMEGERTVVG